MVSVNSTNVAVAANNPIPWQNGTFTSCDHATSNATTITLGKTGLYSIDFDGSISTTAADTSIVSTNAASTPVASAFNTVLRVCTVPTTISVVSDSAITAEKVQLKAIHL